MEICRGRFLQWPLSNDLIKGHKLPNTLSVTGMVQQAAARAVSLLCCAGPCCSHNAAPVLSQEYQPQPLWNLYGTLSPFPPFFRHSHVEENPLLSTVMSKGFILWHSPCWPASGQDVVALKPSLGGCKSAWDRFLRAETRVRNWQWEKTSRQCFLAFRNFWLQLISEFSRSWEQTVTPRGILFLVSTGLGSFL